MKKKKFTSKLNLQKRSISNLANVNGGNVPPYECTEDHSGCTEGGGSGGGGTYTNYCTGYTCGNCLTNNHPVSDPIHCRTCHDAC